DGTHHARQRHAIALERGDALIQTTGTDGGDGMTRTNSTIGAWVVAFVTTASAPMTAHGSGSPHVRSSNERIQKAIRFAIARSESFQDLIATLELFDRVVYIEEGRCPERGSCLHLMPTTGGKNLLIRIDPRQPTRSVIAQLAHELYHAV